MQFLVASALATPLDDVLFTCNDMPKTTNQEWTRLALGEVTEGAAKGNMELQTTLNDWVAARRAFEANPKEENRKRMSAYTEQLEQYGGRTPERFIEDA